MLNDLLQILSVSLVVEIWVSEFRVIVKTVVLI